VGRKRQKKFVQKSDFLKKIVANSINEGLAAIRGISADKLSAVVDNSWLF
jgi:hypothetical protein